MQVAIEVPSIKATLSDREFQLITSIAGDNFNEPQLLPPSALWLEHFYLRPDDSSKTIGYDFDMVQLIPSGTENDARKAPAYRDYRVQRC
jgi:hypothetical protein